VLLLILVVLNIIFYARFLKIFFAKDQLTIVSQRKSVDLTISIDLIKICDQLVPWWCLCLTS